jgi:hypothetical protein
MRSRWYGSARAALALFLLILLEPARCGVPPINAQSADLLPAIVITEGATPQGYPYIFGGVSSNEREAMEARAKDYNLRLVFAAKSGAYLSGVMLVLTTANGAEIVSVATNGPWFYIHSAAGKLFGAGTLRRTDQAGEKSARHKRQIDAAEFYLGFGRTAGAVKARNARLIDD